MFRRIASIAAPTVRSSPSLIRALPVTNAAILGLLQSVNQLAGVQTKSSSSSKKAVAKKSTTTAAKKSNKTPAQASKKKKSTKVTKKVTIGSTKKKSINKKKSITKKKKLSIKNKKKTIAKKVAKKKVTSSTKKETVSKSKVSPAKKKKASATTKKNLLKKKKTTTLKKKKQQKKVTSKKSKTGSKKKILKKKSNKKASSKKKIRASPKSNALVASSSSMSKAILIVQLDKERASRERVQRRLEKITMKYRELLAELASIREIANNLVLENAKRQEALPPPVASTPPPLPTPTPTLPAAEEPVAPAAPPSSFEEVLTHSTGILETKPPAVSQQDVVEEEPVPGQQQESNELVEKQEEEEVLAVNPSSALAPSVDVESALLQGREVRAGEESPNVEDNEATEVEKVTEKSESSVTMKEEKVPEKQEKKKKPSDQEEEIDYSLPPAPRRKDVLDPFQQFRAEVWNDEKLLEQKMKDYDSWNGDQAKKYSEYPEKAKHYAKRHAIWRLWQEEVEKKKTVVEDQTPKAEPAAEKKPSSKEKPAKEPRASKRAKQDRAKPELTSSETSSVTYSDPNDLLTTGGGAAQPYEEPPVVSPTASAPTTDSNNKKKSVVAAATATNKVVDRKVRAEFKKFAQKIWRSKELDAKVKETDALNSWFVKKLPKNEGMGGKLFHAKLFAATQMWKDLKKKKSGDSVLSVDQCKTLVLEAMNEELSE